MDLGQSERKMRIKQEESVACIKMSKNFSGMSNIPKDRLYGGLAHHLKRSVETF